MSDERTLRLAHRPVTPEILEKYSQFIRFEQAGVPASQGLEQVGVTADDVARTASAVNAFCRPRLLKRRLAGANANSVERQLKRVEELARPIDDSGFIALYGEETYRVLRAQEEALIELRAKSVGEG